MKTIKELETAFSRKSKEQQQSEIFHAATNSLEVLEEKTFDMTTKVERPLFSEAEIFAMLREQRKK